MAEEQIAPKKTSISKNFIYNLITQISGIVIPLITTPYLARVLHETGNGQISYVSSIVSYFVLFANLGFSIYGQREIAKYQDDIEGKSRVFWEIFIARTITTVVALGVFYSILFTVGFGERYNLLMLIMSFQVVANLVDIQFLYMGEENFRFIALRTIFLRLLGLILIFIFVKNDTDVWIYATSLTGSMLVSNLLLWPSLFRRIKRCAFPKFSALLRHFKPALIIFFPVMVTTIFTTFDKTMIGWLSPTEEIGDYNNGCYEQAYKINSLAQTVVTIFSAVMFSRNSLDYNKGNIEGMNQHVYKSFQYVLITSFFFTAGFCALSSNFASWFYGEGYTEVPLLLQIMTIRLIAGGMSVVLGDRFIVMKKEMRWTIAVAVGALVNVGINALMIPKYGAVGAAIATALTELCIFIAMASMTFGKRGGLSFRYVLKSSWRYVLAAGISFGVMYGIQYVLHYSIWEFIVIGFAGVAVYVGILLLLRDEFSFSILKRVFHTIKNVFQTMGGRLMSQKTKQRMRRIREYWVGGVLFSAIRQRIWSKLRYRRLEERTKYLQMADERRRFQIICRLRRKLRKAADRFQAEIDRTDADLPHEQSGKIWVFWWQGMENAPKIVRVCYQSILDHYGETHEVILLTEKNYKDYVTLPERIETLFREKKLQVQHFSDFIRLELLIHYGGTWMDATILNTAEMPDYMMTAPLFFPQVLFSSDWGMACRMENWLIHSESNHKILRLVYALMNEYFRKTSIVCDYLLTYDIMEIVLDRYHEDWKKIPPCSNTNLLALQNRLFWKFDETCYNAVLQNAPLHKLTWKFPAENAMKEGTYYRYLLDNFKNYEGKGEPIQANAEEENKGSEE